MERILMFLPAVSLLFVICFLSFVIHITLIKRMQIPMVRINKNDPEVEGFMIQSVFVVLTSIPIIFAKNSFLFYLPVIIAFDSVTPLAWVWMIILATLRVIDKIPRISKRISWFSFQEKKIGKIITVAHQINNPQEKEQENLSKKTQTTLLTFLFCWTLVIMYLAITFQNVWLPILVGIGVITIPILFVGVFFLIIWLVFCAKNNFQSWLRRTKRKMCVP